MNSHVADLAGATALGHGGTAGAVVESIVVLGIVAVFLAVWLGSRRQPEEDEEGDPPRG